MGATANTLGDVPSDTFTILAFSDARHPERPAQPRRPPKGLTFDTLCRPRCTACGIRKTSIRVLDTASDELHHSALRPTLEEPSLQKATAPGYRAHMQWFQRHTASSSRARIPAAASTSPPPYLQRQHLTPTMPPHTWNPLKDSCVLA
jgi:hypothetical protein